MSSRRQRNIPWGGRYRQVALYLLYRMTLLLTNPTKISSMNAQKIDWSKTAWNTCMYVDWSWNRLSIFGLDKSKLTITAYPIAVSAFMIFLSSVQRSMLSWFWINIGFHVTSFVSEEWQQFCNSYHPLVLFIRSISFDRIKCIKNMLTHWGRVTHICVWKLTIFDSGNGLSPGRRQAIIWTNAGILLIVPFWTNFSKISSAKFIYFYSRKCIWKCRLRNGGHFHTPY